MVDRLKVLYVTDSLTYFQKDLFDEFARQGLETRPLYFRTPYTFWNKFRNVRSLVTKARKSGVVFIEFLGSHAYSFSRFKKWHKRPIFVRCHRTELFDLTPRNLEKLGFSVKHVDKIICVSKAIQKRLLSLCPEAKRNSIVIYNGVDVQRYHPINHKPNSPFQIGSLGYLIPRKGYEGLIQVISDLIDEGYNLMLHIGGEGPLKEKLKRLIENLGKQDHIFLDGYISEEKLNEWYALKDLYVQNSFSEGHSVSILEAMSCGLPVLATDVGGASETLPANWIYPVNDVKTLKSKLKWFLELPDQARLKIGKENRMKVIEQFNLSKQAQKIIRLFEDALK